MPSIQSYILSYYRLRKRESLIALGSHQGGCISFLHPRYPQRGVGTDLKTLAWLAEVVANCLVASYDTLSESAGIPAWGNGHGRIVAHLTARGELCDNRRHKDLHF